MKDLYFGAIGNFVILLLSTFLLADKIISGFLLINFTVLFSAYLICKELKK